MPTKAEAKFWEGYATRYVLTMYIENGRLHKPEGRSDRYNKAKGAKPYFEGAKWTIPSETRRVFTTENHKEYLAKKKEWTAEYQADRSAKKAAIQEAKLPKFSNPRVKEIVKILFEKQRNAVIAMLKRTYDARLELLKPLEGLTERSKEAQAIIGIHANAQRQDPELRRLYWEIFETKEKYSSHGPKFLKSNYSDIIEKKIARDLESIMGGFLNKMEIKLTDTIKNKEIKEFKSEGMYSGYVSFIFEDGSRFEMENSIEWGRSKFGLSFNRYPCRFKDVYFADGTMMKQPSEAKMQKEF